MINGKLRHRIQVVKPAGIRNSFGEITDDIVLVATKYAGIRVISDSENGTNRIGSNNITEFKIRYDQSLENPSNDMYILFKNKEYDITSVINYNEMNIFLTIKATLRS